MPKLQQDDERISPGANLLISILVRYPEVGTINYEAESGALRFTFMLATIPAADEFTHIKDKLLASIAAYHLLEGIKGARVDVCLIPCDRVAMLAIRRDVATLTKGEMALIIVFLRDALKDRLVADENDAILEEDLLVQEEVISDMLESMKRENAAGGLIGIREDGRVLVFNK